MMTDLLFMIQFLIPLLAIVLLVGGFGFFAFALQHRKRPSAAVWQDHNEPAVAWHSVPAVRTTQIETAHQSPMRERPNYSEPSSIANPADPRPGQMGDQLEDQFLKAFFQQPDLPRAIDEFLQRIVTGTESGFAAIVGSDRHSPTKTVAVGLRRESIEQLRIPSDLVRRLRTENPLCLQRPLSQSTAFSSISEIERLKGLPVYLTALHDGDEIFAVLVTSFLWPSQLPDAERKPFMKRVTRQIGMRW